MFATNSNALEYFRERVPMSAEAYYALQTQAREKGFTVSHVTELRMLEQVQASLERAVEKGADLKAWREEMTEALENAWGGTVANPGARMALIFRNAAQRSFNAGRYKQTQAPAIQRIRPFGRLDSINDQRRTDLCEKLHGTLLPLDDQRWTGLIPPLHHGCRTLRRTLRRITAQRFGGVKEPPEGVFPAKGFGAAPTFEEEVPPPPLPDPKKTDQKLLKKFETKQKRAKRKPAPKPAAVPKEHDPAHWERKNRRAMGEAAKPIGWGKAATERGLDRPIGQVRSTASVLAKSGVPEWENMERRIERLQKSYKAKTLRDAEAKIDKLIAKSGESAELLARKGEIRTYAALTEHASTVDAAGTIDLPNAPQGKAPGDDPFEGVAKNIQRRHFREATSFYETLAEKSLAHPRQYTYRFDVARAFHNADDQVMAFSNIPGADVVVHEWGHALEALNDSLARAARTFLGRRTIGEPFKRLDELYPGSKYDFWERCRKDKFWNAYCGKEYSSGATEILSMGLQRIMSGDTQFAIEDPEYFQFCLGALAGNVA